MGKVEQCSMEVGAEVVEQWSIGGIGRQVYVIMNR